MRVSPPLTPSFLLIKIKNSLFFHPLPKRSRPRKMIIVTLHMCDNMCQKSLKEPKTNIKNKKNKN